MSIINSLRRIISRPKPHHKTPDCLDHLRDVPPYIPGTYRDHGEEISALLREDRLEKLAKECLEMKEKKP
jgi:hypothetical protein